MDYLITVLTEIQAFDVLTQVKGYAEGKRLAEKKPKPTFENNVIKFKSLIGRETSTETKEVGVSMNKKPTLGSIKKMKDKDLYRGRFQYKGIVYTTTAKRFADCFDKHEAKIKEVMEQYNEVVVSGKLGFNKNMLLKDWYDYWYKTYKESDLKQWFMKRFIMLI